MESLNLTALTEEEFVLYFVNKGLISDYYYCDICNILMENKKRNGLYRNKPNYVFQCTRCYKSQSVYKYTIFEKVYLTLKVFFIIILYFSVGLTFKQTKEVLAINGINLSYIYIYICFRIF
jgi:hypothetical protein